MLVAAYIVFFNGMAFLVIISRHVKFTTVKYLGNRTTGNISKSLENINDVYYTHGMYVETLYMYRYFEKIIIIIPVISTFNTTASYEHVPEIEK